MNDRSPLVSVIIPCWNQARFLRECIGSLQIQSYRNWEAIIVNDGSPDNARACGLGLAGEDPRVRYLEQTNRGVSGARNAGMSAARGAYLQFLDADDLLEPVKLGAQVQALAAQPAVGVAFGDAAYFGDGAGRHSGAALPMGCPQEQRAGWCEGNDHQGQLLSSLLRRNVFAINCLLVRRGVVEAIGPWTERLVALEDWDYWVRAAAAGVRFQYVAAPQTRALVRLHPGSATRDTQRMQRAAVDFRVEAASVIRRPADLLYNAKAALRSNARLGVEGRSARYRRLFVAHRNALARFYIVVCFLFGAQSVCGRFIPWRVRNALAQRFLAP